VRFRAPLQQGVAFVTAASGDPMCPADLLVMVMAALRLTTARVQRAYFRRRHGTK
jgi:hypothetical protein